MKEHVCIQENMLVLNGNSVFYLILILPFFINFKIFFFKNILKNLLDKYIYLFKLGLKNKISY